MRERTEIQLGTSKHLYSIAWMKRSVTKTIKTLRFRFLEGLLISNCEEI